MNIKQISLAQAKSIQQKEQMFTGSTEFADFQEKRARKVLSFGIYENNECVDCFHVFLFPFKKFFTIATINYLPTKFIQSNLINDLQPILKKHRVLELYVVPKILEYTLDPTTSSPIINTEFESVAKQLEALGFTKTKVKHPAMEYLWQYRKSIREYPDEQALFKSYSQTHRNSVTRGNKMGCVTKELGYDELAIIHQLFNESAEKQHFPQLPLSYFQQLYNSFKDSHKLLVMCVSLDISKALAYLENSKKTTEKELHKLRQKHTEDAPAILESLKAIDSINERIHQLSSLSNETTSLPLSAGIFIKDHDELIHFIGGNNTQYTAYLGSHVLQHTMMLRAKELGYDVYNFYCTDAPYTDLPPKDYGVYHFKKGFNGEPIKYAHFTYTVSPLLTKLLK